MIREMCTIHIAHQFVGVSNKGLPRERVATTYAKKILSGYDGKLKEEHYLWCSILTFYKTLTITIMRIRFVFCVLFVAGLSLEAFAQTYEYKILTSVESIIPGGLGRSRIIENTTQVDASLYTTSRSGGTDSQQGNVKRKDVKVDALNETKLLNFFSAVGINFQNIASNDAMLSSALDALSSEGWELAFVTSGVESDAGTGDGQGIFVTRFIFKRAKN